jgi:hypothetical protein
MDARSRLPRWTGLRVGRIFSARLSDPRGSEGPRPRPWSGTRLIKIVLPENGSSPA